MDSESPNAPIDKDESLETVEPIEVAEVVENTEVAELAEAVEPIEVAEVAQYADPAEDTQKPQKYEPVISHQLPPQFQNVAAKGGAVAALVLGLLAVFGAFITQWSLFNAVIGMVLGLWGLGSSMPRTAVVGILLCGIGFFLCVAVPSLF